MIHSDTEILKKISSDIELIKKALKIIPDRESIISDFQPSIHSYEEFAKEELKLESITINNQKSSILGYLNHSKGIINKQTVKSYLDSNESQSWKTNQIKALRKYIRNFLKLGNWMEEFKFSKTKIKAKKIALPNNEHLAEFCSVLPYQVQIIFFVLFNSGLRIGEVLSLKWSDLNLETRMIDASNIHKGETKFSWISFFTEQTLELLENYLLNDESEYVDENSKLFSVSARSVQQAFKNASDLIGISLNPHLLRTVFAERCREAKIKTEYIDAFCGRTPKGMLAQHYTEYSPEALRKQYDMIEPHLTLPLS